MESKKGILINIEGTDASGKETQSILLRDYFINKYNYTIGKDIDLISFPMYGMDSATMVEKYLQGKFGSSPNDVDPYTASLFYAIDRSISYHNYEWGKIYNNCGIIITDRYVTSNIIHQSFKLDIFKNKGATPKDIALDKNFIDFVSWLYELEYSRIKIPKPDLMIVLMSSDESYRKMINGRSGYKDILEKDLDYQITCRTALKAFKELVCLGNQTTFYDFISNTTFAFIDINNKNHDIRSIEDIHNDIISVINAKLNDIIPTDIS